MKVRVFFFLVFLTSDFFSQTIAPYCASIQSNGRPSDCWYDSINDHLLIAGNFTTFMGQVRNRFAEINATSGQLQPFVVVFNSSADEIESDGSRLFFSGQFTQVNGVSRNRLAAIDRLTGQTLPWNPSPNGAIMSICICSGKLVVSGLFTQISGQARSGLAIYDLNSLSLLSINYTHHSLLPIKKIKAFDSILAFCSDENLYVYNAVSANLIDSFYCPLINDFTIYNNTVYACGEFYTVFTPIDSANRNFVFSYDLSQHVFLPVNPVLTITAQAIELLNDTLILSSFNYINSIAYGEVRKFDKQSGQAFSLYDPFLPAFFNQRFFHFADKFISIINSSNFTTWQQYFRVYFLQPSLPFVNEGYSFSVCRNDTLQLSLQHRQGNEFYTWSYTGQGASLFPNQKGDSIKIIFSSNSSSGNLLVYSISMSGIFGPTQTLSIQLKAVPFADAGLSIILNCKITQDSLRAIPTNTTIYDYKWTGPHGFQSFLPSVPINSTFSKQGKYELTITRKSNACRNKDSTFVIFDTLRPAIFHPFIQRTLTCLQDSLAIDAFPFYTNDSLRWLTQGGLGLNPLMAFIPGIYSVLVMSRANFCTAVDTFNIFQDVSPPLINGLPSSATLTCADTIITLNASVSSQNPIVFWNGNNLDSVSNPMLCTIPGLYTVNATNPSNGCNSQQVVYVFQNTLKPHLKILHEKNTLTCTDSTILVKKSTLSSYAETFWISDSAVHYTDTLWVSSPGWYRAISIDSINTCTTQDSVWITFDSTFVTNLRADTTICIGDAFRYPLSQVGGSGPHMVWLNDTYEGLLNFINISPVSDTMLRIKLIDQKGCRSVDSISINVSPLPDDSVVIYKFCDASLEQAEIQVFTNGENPPFQFSLNESNWGVNPIFNNVPFGYHLLMIKDAIGCVKWTEVIIDENAQLPEILFLSSTNQTTQDTFLLIDLSQPSPDSCNFLLSGNTLLVDKNPPYYFFVHQDTGIAEIRIQVYYPGCRYEIIKSLNINLQDSLVVNKNERDGIEEFICYPNPTSGILNLSVLLNWKQNVFFEVYDLYGTKVYSSNAQNGTTVNWQADLSFLNEGVNYIKVVSEADMRNILIVKHE